MFSRCAVSGWTRMERASLCCVPEPHSMPRYVCVCVCVCVSMCSDKSSYAAMLLKFVGKGDTANSFLSMRSNDGSLSSFLLSLSSLPLVWLSKTWILVCTHIVHIFTYLIFREESGPFWRFQFGSDRGLSGWRQVSAGVHAHTQWRGSWLGIYI